MSVFLTPIGHLEVIPDECVVYSSIFTDKPLQHQENQLSHQIISQLESYFKNPLHQFNLPLKPRGTPFQLRVQKVLLEIPSGHTLSYGELALKLNSAPRAIGQACKRNSHALFIPCHRVVGKNDLGGFMGNPQFISYKEALLALESHK